MPSEAVFPSIQITIYKSRIERLQDLTHFAQLREQTQSLIHIGHVGGCGDLISVSIVMWLLLIILLDKPSNQFVL